MSEVEKMYENAKVKKYRLLDRGNKLKWVYPKFTAEKQIELIKWLGHRRHLDIDIHNIKGCTIYDISNDYDCIVGEHKFMFDSNTFEDALAGLINQVYYSLTSEEKQQIREILGE